MALAPALVRQQVVPQAEGALAVDPQRRDLEMFRHQRLKVHLIENIPLEVDAGGNFYELHARFCQLEDASLRTGTVTAGNSSSLNDAAAAVVVMSREKAEELGVTPVLSIGGYAVAGLSADIMGYAPKLSSEKLAKQLGLSLPDIDMFEINEAFASQSFAVRRDLGLDPEKVNIYGGGISIGHPIGATGCILVTKVFYELKRTDKKDAMISMCIGGGQGISMYFTKI